MSFTAKTSPDLLSLNKVASRSLSVINPLNAQLDLALWGSAGLGALQQELQSQLNASVQAGVDMGMHQTNPYLGFQRALSGAAQVVAQVQAALSGSGAFPTPELGAISANAALTASLGVRVGALKAALSGVMSAKLPAIQFAQDLGLSLNLGPVKMIAWDLEKADGVSSRIKHEIEKDYGDSATYGVLFVAQKEEVWGALKYLFKTS